jgi:hypothetical protein
VVSIVEPHGSSDEEINQSEKNALIKTDLGECKRLSEGYIGSLIRNPCGSTMLTTNRFSLVISCRYFPF